MSPPAEGADAPRPSFFLNFVKTLAFLLLCGIVGPIFLFLSFGTGLAWMFWTGLGITVLDVLIAIAIAAGRTRSQERTYRLQRTGRRGSAHVLSVEQTGVRINDQPLLELRVRIEGSDVTPFEVETKSVISDVRLPLLYGGPLPVLVDPETREWEFDWDAARPVSYGAAAVAATPVDQRPVADRLAELDGLFQRDLLSREEYDAARARILGEL